MCIVHIKDEVKQKMALFNPLPLLEKQSGYGFYKSKRLDSFRYSSSLREYLTGVISLLRLVYVEPLNKNQS